MKTSRVLTKGELVQISKRIDEISEAIDLCTPGFDDDVLDNLDAELEALEARLKASLTLALELEGRSA
jgi:hypothetical protein